MKKRESSGVQLIELKKLIRAKRYSLRKLAPEVNMGYNTLSLKLNGHSDFTTSEIFALCNVLKIPNNLIGHYFFPSMFPKETLTA